MTTTVLFDVNETLLDLSPIRELLDERFAGDVDTSDWFAELLRLSFVSSATNTYVPFSVLAGDALATVAGRSGTAASEDDLTTLGRTMRSLPPHPDVMPGLALLRDAGVPLAAVTNSPLETAQAQITSAGLDTLFDRILSVDLVQRFKPHRSVYDAAVAEMGAHPSATVMVAAHDWDIAGAKAAGLRGVFVRRPGQEWSPAFSPPDANVPSIVEAAHWVLDR
ncbi:MAG: haloacid dehalogenase type II [Acidimicrobiia bacterium]